MERCRYSPFRDKKTALWVIGLVFLFITPLWSQYVRRMTFATEKERRAHYQLDDWISYLESNHLTSISVGNEYIYFSTWGGGILRYHIYDRYWDYPFTTSNGLASNFVQRVVYDHGTGLLWAITKVDTCVFIPAEQEWLCQSEAYSWPYRFPGIPVPEDTEQIAHDVFYPEKYLNRLPDFFANGYYTLTADWSLIDDNFDEFPIRGFLRDSWERVWFLIEGLGIGVGGWYERRMDVIPLGLLHFIPRAMAYQDHDLWIGGEPLPGGRTGIVHWRNQDGAWEYFRAKYIAHLRSDDVRAIAVTGDSVWFGTLYGLALYNQAKNRWKYFGVKDGLYDHYITDLAVVGRRLYIGTINGLNWLDLPSGIIKRVKDKNVRLATIHQIAAQKDTLWLATNRGIFRRLPGQPKWDSVITKAAIQDLPVTAVEVFHQEVWFASPGGIFWLDTKSNNWEGFPQIGMEISGPFLDLAVNQKSVWVTSSMGLLKYDRERQYWRIFTTEDGLLSNQCFRLLLDGDYIWVTTLKGITQFYWNSPRRID